MKTKKPTKAEQLKSAERKIQNILESLDFEDVLSFIVRELQRDIELTEIDIEDELEYAKNETDSYASQKAEARRMAKILKKKLQRQKESLKQVQKAFTAVRKMKNV